MWRMRFPAVAQCRPLSLVMIQMNGQACEGRYTIESRVETDVLLHFGAGSCRIEVVGAHAEGSVHTDLPTEPKVDGH